ncbi:hypothetical protein HOLleu_22560 [Holothuria leucospilota]|uniref:Death domain-containing protein n=1 Tax=Holothuria leucospilota TaxID=206669 RepID=A0A9Q1BZA9_HOLLE|nr:hypothetical protein HOLleu_22560 [Holothuria leucospilota]
MSFILTYHFLHQKGPLCDEILWMIATNLQNDWEEVAFHLGMSIYAVNRIAICYPPQERLFAVLRDWRSHSLKMNPPQETSVELANTMIKLNRYDLSQIVLHRFQQSLMCA